MQVKVVFALFYIEPGRCIVVIVLEGVCAKKKIVFTLLGDSLDNTVLEYTLFELQSIVLVLVILDALYAFHLNYDPM